TNATYFSAQVPDPHQWNKQDLYVGTLWFQQKIDQHFTQKLTLGFADQRYALENGDVANGGYIGSYVAPYDGFMDPDCAGTFNKGQLVPVYQFAMNYTTMERNRQADYNLRYENGPISGIIGGTYLWQDFAQ